MSRFLTLARALVAAAPCAGVVLTMPALAAPSLATPPSTSLRPDPLDPQAAVTPLPHRSVWGPRPASTADAAPVDWREAHEAVRRAGGWRALSREVQREVPR